MQANELIRYHDDHCQGKAIKGINQLTALYHSGQNWPPVALQLIHKDQQTTRPTSGTITGPITCRLFVHARQ